ncbi:hypothetical protein CLAFUW4_10679 [Fulvia fulva]|uniref:RING-type domain-containing protein n=1 Tax=Passalora fulva TaxID=5499 RepID=A0A9Q8P790_PASFU|nr:uncharacterized protein CLAFUR5_05293 [Fulvia fulva]KAK4616281.1 hypothetical protein CLAFUR4_10684 [Fulvia fulva]KAK4617193.1 hypothetical protein CLAFUR0_10559 [Fulvia fulva]UJO15854.1 hypothetical protein CLAFUR5_05293 [Fulvia fulva]WPV19367.1 hypothetical protein CLAFUW4_10679 [Fulvia fulva]WPV33882.1 hypothetical protein CLAFUW7_10681 [Fulvia fulva]
MAHQRVVAFLGIEDSLWKLAILQELVPNPIPPTGDSHVEQLRAAVQGLQDMQDRFRENTERAINEGGSAAFEEELGNGVREMLQFALDHIDVLEAARDDMSADDEDGVDDDTIAEIKAKMPHVDFDISAEKPRRGISAAQFQLEKEQLVEDCAICYVEPPVDNEPLETACGHIYCAECLVRWCLEHNTCPDCRQEALLEDMVLLDVVRQ